MALSDPFSSTYEGSFKAGSTLGAGIGSAVSDVSDAVAKNKRKQEAYNTLKAAGMIKENITPPSDDELKKGLEEAAKEAGVSQVNWMESDDPKETRRSLEGTYKALGIPLPKGKTTIDYNLAPGTKYKVNDDLVMEGEKKDKSIADQVAEYTMMQKMLANSGLGNDMEVTGYDQKGKPMLRKVKRDVQGEKFDLEQKEKEDLSNKKSQLVKDAANNALGTIKEVESGLDNFGTLGNLPSFPGTKRVNWEANVNKLKSEQVLNTIKEMKDASKTGATGFGALSEKELSVLENAATALRKDLPKEDAQRYLNQIKTSMQKIITDKAEEDGSDSEYQNYLKAIGQ